MTRILSSLLIALAFPAAMFWLGGADLSNLHRGPEAVGFAASAIVLFAVSVTCPAWERR